MEQEITDMKLLDRLAEVDTSGIIEGSHPYELASEEARIALDRDLEKIAIERELRERTASTSR